MSELPTGTVTFLFTDIEGSTQLLQDLGEDYPALLGAHHDILLEVIEAAGGSRVSTEGDGTFSVFTRPIDAIDAAVSAQRTFAAGDLPGGGRLGVRMGIHTGDGVIGPDGYVGIDVHRAARISSVGNGGQVVVSGPTQSLIEHALPEGVSLIDLGRHRLRDLAEPEHLFQLSAAGLESGFPPLRSLDAVRNNLPLQLTSFVGRDDELAELGKLLRVSRLVTLTGVGGTGKTRLSLQAAAEISHEFPDGVWIAELAPLGDPGLVANELASGMGLRPQPGERMIQTLASVVRGQEVLVILDNCEHLLDAVAEVAVVLLQAGPGVRIMATSREALGVPGEVSYPVSSLAVPKGDLTDGENLLRYDAIELFAERASFVKPGFFVTGENSEAVVQICRRLDGVPLAIELAAARIRSLSPEDIASRLDDRFRLLTGGSRTVLPRQQTLEATVAWSYDHLSEDEKLLFNRLSVFAGGFTLEMTEAVCSGDDVAESDVLDLVVGLVDKSLVVVEEGVTGTRYRQLETLRQYGRNRLADHSDPDSVRRRHANAYADLAERLDPVLRGPQQVEAFRRFEAEHDNMRAALMWAKDASESTLLLRLTAALGYFWEEAGHWPEGRSWMAVAPLADDTLPLDLRVTAALRGSGMVISDDKEAAAALADETLERASRLNDPSLHGQALALSGLTAAWLGETDRAVEILESALALCRETGDRWALADVLSTFGSVLSRDHVDRAEEVQSESLQLYRELGDRLQAAGCLYLLGNNVLIKRPEDAASWLSEGLELFREVGSRSGEGHALLWLGAAQRSLEDPAALQTLRSSLVVLGDVGDQHCGANAERELALLELSSDPVGAKTRLDRSLTMSQAVVDRANMALVMEALGKIAVRADDMERAVTLYGAAAPLFAGGRAREASAEADRQPEFDRAREELDEDEYQAAWDAGKGMPVEEAVEFALADHDSRAD